MPESSATDRSTPVSPLATPHANPEGRSDDGLDNEPHEHSEGPTR